MNSVRERGIHCRRCGMKCADNRDDFDSERGNQESRGLFAGRKRGRYQVHHERDKEESYRNYWINKRGVEEIFGTHRGTCADPAVHQKREKRDKNKRNKHVDNLIFHAVAPIG